MKNTLLITLTCLLYIVGFLFSYTYLWDTFSVDSLRNILEYTVMFISLILFNTLLWKNKWTRIIALLLITLISLNFAISISCYTLYNSPFNVGMAVSIIDTHPDEVFSMSSMFVVPIITSLFFFGMQLYCVRSLSQCTLPRFAKYAALIWLILPVVFLLKHRYVSNLGGGFMVKNTVYHAMDFYRAFDLQKEIKNLQNIKVNYDVQRIADPTEIIVLVIGESVRADHMSLYGYPRKTTPYEDQERHNMYIYNDAASPASITNLSIPLTLSSIQPEDFETKNSKLADNLIKLAQHESYKTFWYSTQGDARSITAIASMASEKKWINAYDEALIPYLDKALQEPGKKFIVLHMVGSHPDPCDKYPPSEQRYKKDNYIDCYDNSIAYTDKILGQIFSQLSAYPAALFYLSDHGLKLKDQKFIHGDYREATKVPFYIWNSPRLDPKLRTLGEVSQPTQTTVMYPMIMQYMGLQKPTHYKSEDFKFLKLDFSIIDYNNLP